MANETLVLSKLLQRLRRRNHSINLALLSTFLFSCATPSKNDKSDQPCRLEIGSPVTSKGIDWLKIGAPISALKIDCPSLVFRSEQDPEGLSVTVGEVPREVAMVQFTIEQDRVAMIRIMNERITDARGNRPGGLLRIAPGVQLFGTEDDGRLFVHERAACGLSYLTDIIPDDQSHLGTWTMADLAMLKGLRITDIRLVGCRSKF